jgi:hypothetical protein
MDRRKFVRSTLLSGPVLAGVLPSENATAMKSKKQQWYELRTYTFANDAQRELTSTYLEQTYVPALNRAGSRNTGVFTEYQPQGPGKMFVLIPFDSVDSFAALNGKLPYDAAEAAHPAYERIESSLLKAFLHMPQMEIPEKKDRLFELRCYESPSEAAGQKKIEMFNDAGEIDIFKKAGARPVFFGETIIGLRRPNLTYMLCFDDMNGHDACWKAFGSDPEWKKISAIPEYSDARLISRITRTFLSPTNYSQI